MSRECDRERVLQNLHLIDKGLIIRSANSLRYQNDDDGDDCDDDDV